MMYDSKGVYKLCLVLIVKIMKNKIFNKGSIT